MTNHGGPRKGAGRKPLFGGQPMTRVTVSLPIQVLPLLRKLGSGNLSAGIRALLDKYLSSESA